MKTKSITKMIIGMLVACFICIYAGTADAAGIKKAAITKGVSFVKKTFDNVGNAIWNNKGAIAVGAATVAIVTQPEIHAQPVTAATTAVATETSKAIYCSPIRTIGAVFFFAALLVIAWTMVCIARHYLKLWHILPLLLVCVLIFSGGVAEAGTMPIAAAHMFPLKPFIDVVGWIIIVIVTIFI